MDLDIAGEYIYEAALLIQLKSKMLLPRPRNLAGEVIEEDPRAELVQRLLEYRRIKEAAQALAEVDRMRVGDAGLTDRPAERQRAVAGSALLAGTPVLRCYPRPATQDWLEPTTQPTAQRTTSWTC